MYLLRVHVREYVWKFVAVLLSLAVIMFLVPKSRHILTSDIQAGVKSGLSGAAAGFLQVLAFMWLRTVLNVQYANGGDFSNILKELWNEGGIPRFLSRLCSSTSAESSSEIWRYIYKLHWVAVF